MPFRALTDRGRVARYRDRRDLSPTETNLLGPGHSLLITDHGPLDLLGAIANALAHEDLVSDTIVLDLGGADIPVLELVRGVRRSAKTARGASWPAE